MERTSAKRNAILALLRSTTTHPTAEWVYAHLKPEWPELSLATVYRNLAYFKETGQLTSVGTVNGKERWDARTDDHAHFICTGCDRIWDLPVICPPSLTRCAEKASGSQITGCRISFTGVCADCQPPDTETTGGMPL
ncbi:MAG: transcriptional repressor [Oscillospiraceae bacterium]|nr:transcriptional repressor [Oscillospiraceae bacterium]